VEKITTTFRTASTIAAFVIILAVIVGIGLYIESFKRFLPLSSTPPAKLPSAVYPLKISENKRYLTDQNNVPFLLQGDAAWSLIVALTKEEAEHYLKDRREKGFNTLMVNLIEHRFCRNPPRNVYGDEPFTEPGDFTAPNEKYFAHVDWVIEKAAEYGIQLLLAPIYLGYEGTDQGWFEEVIAAGPEKCLEYGRYLGDRYKDFDNIIWLMGGDRNPGPSLEHVNAVARGIKEYDKHHLFTAHCAPETSAAYGYAGCDWLDFNNAYSYQTVHRKVAAEYSRRPIMPVVLLESTYEGEHSSTPMQIRRQAYWAILCGGFGHVFGNYPIWPFDSGWQAAMDAEGSVSMTYWGRLFRSLRWYELIPDQKQELVVAGSGNPYGLDYLTAARTPDNSTIIAYMPSSRTVTVDMSKISGSKAKAWWFDPQTGNATSLGEFQTTGLEYFTPPKEGDWVLVVGDSSWDLPQPVTGKIET